MERDGLRHATLPKSHHMKMTVLGYGLIFQPVLVSLPYTQACTLRGLPARMVYLKHDI